MNHEWTKKEILKRKLKCSLKKAHSSILSVKVVRRQVDNQFLSKEIVEFRNDGKLLETMNHE